ncbi:beta-propeller domain-containing protein [Candidatus Poriferisodalis sp.]|uniref:beta-propeller domain-containing protein n=1 Tax=Candidatus Poriferisodalis sp. TaxID=3101277 RepID=UPI003B594A5A
MSGRLLVVLLAAGLFAAACTSDSADAPAGDSAAPTTSPSTATDGEQPDAPTTEDPDAEMPSDDALDTAAGDAGVNDDSSGEVSEQERIAAEEERQRVEEERRRREAEERLRRQREADGAQTASLERFSDCGPLLDYVHANAAQAVGPWGLGDGFGIEGERLEEGAIAVDEAASGDFASLQAGVDFSTSNVQEAGIDEPDVLKTDGERIVFASENRVHVVDVTGAEPELVASLTLGDHWGSRLLLHGNRVFVFSSRWDVIPPLERDADGALAAIPVAPEPDWGPTTEVVEIDLAGSTPSIVRRLSIEGNYVSARMTEGVVRIVTSSRPRAIPWAVPREVGRTAEEQAAKTNREVVASTTVDHWLPRYNLSDSASATLVFGRLVQCDRVWAPAHYSGPGTLSVTTIDIAADGLEGSLDTTSIMSDGSTVYASPEHLYVTTTRWFNWHTQPQGPDDGTLAETEIHVFDTGDVLSSHYVGSATVTGTALNQYSMSSHEGHLRIATTTIPPWRFEGGPDFESLVTVFAVDAGGLSQVGQIGGLGVGERIFAVRYLGDIAAVVTFRQTDPLYIIDLTDPALPTVRGELKIHGYSAYLHPVGTDRLLGVGQDADEEGRTLGTQVSLFDISDLDRPKRIAQWTAPGGRSQVEFDALAFLYWPPTDLAVLPMNQYPNDENEGDPPFLGAVALTTVDDELSEFGRFSHADPPLRECRESRLITVRPDGTEEVGPLERYCWYDVDYEARVAGSAVIAGRLYLASNKALESIELGSTERISLLRWAD